MKIPLHDILEELTGIGQINSKEDLNKLILELKKLPSDTVIDLQKYAGE